MFITWSPDLELGVPAVDQQHRRLVAIINELHESMIGGQGREVIGAVLGELDDYTRRHFSAEEELMERASYKALASHRQLHRGFEAKLAQYHERHDAGEEALTTEVTVFLSRWLIGHIKGEDRTYVPHL